MAKGRYSVRLACTSDDTARAQRLRWLAFVAQRQRDTTGDGLDADDMDAQCQHVLIEEPRTGTLVCTFRFFHFSTGHQIDQSYSAHFYNLSALSGFDAPMVEMGRFCIHPEHHNPDILRVAWRFMTRYVDDHRVEMLFGCSSFNGTRPEDYTDVFAILRDRYLAPKRWLPRVKAPRVFRFARLLRARKPDARMAMAAMPPLLRTYLMMGGWVSDHAVIDLQLDTLHVFTGLEVKAIPPVRAHLLRGAAD